MKKSILLFFISLFCAMGLFAQSKKADSASKVKTEAKATSYTMTDKDSLIILENSLPANVARPSSHIEDITPFNRMQFPPTGINDVIDVEHEIK
jgi:hypothetical protein